MKKLYIKKYCDFVDFSVWIVDGEYIRDNIDEEFTNFGQHYRFKFIPENEFWIDREHGGDDEKRFFIENMLIQNHLMSKGVPYSKAVIKAEAAEKRERKRRESISKNQKRIIHSPRSIKQVHKKLIKKYSGKINVWIVNGRIVRDLFYVDFTEGGHDKVYNFVPKNEIWLDDDLGRKERKFVLLHEAHERNLMSKGMDYDSAHKFSSEIEYLCRKHRKKVDVELKNEFEIAENN